MTWSRPRSCAGAALLILAWALLLPPPWASVASAMAEESSGGHAVAAGSSGAVAADDGAGAPEATGSGAGTDDQANHRDGRDRRDDTQENVSVTRHEMQVDGTTLPYEATASRIAIPDTDEPAAFMFFVSYVRLNTDPSTRPLTFVFNGGPGAAAAYLHLGAMGPKHVVLNDDGSIPPPPPRLAANPLTWLGFTDLVFVDPVGTGYSRAAKAAKKEGGGAGRRDSRSPFWETGQDLNALGDFIRLYLTRHQRRLSPVFLAGESYGGFRVAALSKKLTSDVGVGLNGVILISPVLEFSLMYGDAYDLLPWSMLLPSYAATAAAHGKAELPSGDDPGYDLGHDLDNDLEEALKPVEAYVLDGYLTTLARGSEAGEKALTGLYAQTARYVGLPVDLVRRLRARVPRDVFAKRLLEEQEKVVSLYDGSVTGIDPSPQSTNLVGDDPVLEGLTAPLSSALVAYVRDDLQYESELRYELLNADVFRAWRWRKDNKAQGYLGAADDLKAAMSLNPHLHALVAHGYFDLVTPYFASRYVVDQMALDDAIRPNLELRTYRGGHMFYTHADARRRFYQDARAFYREAAPSSSASRASAPAADLNSADPDSAGPDAAELDAGDPDSEPAPGSEAEPPATPATGTPGSAAPSAPGADVSR